MKSLILFLLSFTAQAESLKTVQLEQFQVGTSWTWAYSEIDTLKGQWQAPYLFEQYTVTQINGSKVTIEMASAPQFPVTTKPHHKFIADVNTCLIANANSQKRRPWFITFYTHSFGPDWELVSAAHKPLAFMEKFNCVAETKPGEKLRSEYIQEEGPFVGVAFRKFFDTKYKFELVK